MSKTTLEQYRLIPLTRGLVAKVDASDYEWLSQWKWMAHTDPRRTKVRFYAIRIGPRIDGKRQRIAMHREILGLKNGDKRQPDHINLDSLDNRRSNLRVATLSENCRNRSMRSDNTSGMKGVYPFKNRWCAQIKVDGIQHFLGSFKSPEEAHAAYVSKVEEMHGQFGREQ